MSPAAPPSPIAITLGDPAGIGPEIVVKAFLAEPALLAGCFAVGDLAHLRRAAAVVAGDGPPIPVVAIERPPDALTLPPRCLPLLQVGPAGGLVAWGQVQARGGALAAAAVAWGAQAALRGEVAALVTAPLHKEALALAGIVHPGHTELLQALAAAHGGVAPSALPVRMMLANRELRTVLVSIHLPLAEAIAQVTRPNVLATLRIAHAALSASLGRPPRLAVAGLNPHAGEGGRFGREELDHIAPAVADACGEDIAASGPFAPDTVFMRARRGEFDAVIAMYHDQGLIPVKYLGVEHGVNVTLGLRGTRPRPWRLVRTSPDHGTAFDIAGTGRAGAASLIEAVRLARELAAVPGAATS